MRLGEPSLRWNLVLLGMIVRDRVLLLVKACVPVLAAIVKGSAHSLLLWRQQRLSTERVSRGGGGTDATRLGKNN